MRGRVVENGVSDHDATEPQPADDLDDFVSVDAAVDAVLMLDDGNVAVVQQFEVAATDLARTVSQFADHPGITGR